MNKHLIDRATALRRGIGLVLAVATVLSLTGARAAHGQILQAGIINGPVGTTAQPSYQPGELHPRVILPPSPFRTIPKGFDPWVWTVKLHEGTAIRLRNGGLKVDAAALDSEALFRRDRLKLSAGLINEGLGALEMWLQIFGGKVAPLMGAAEKDLDQLRQNGQQRSGRELADLNLYYAIKLPESLGEGTLLMALDALRGLSIVEDAYPTPIGEGASLGAAPIGDDLTAEQGYRAAAPAGIDDLYMDNHAGNDGDGVNVVDIERGLYAHEDLPDIQILDPDNTWVFSTGRSANHGTAVMGVMAGVDNGFGVTGICPDARFAFSSANRVVWARTLLTNPFTGAQFNATIPVPVYDVGAAVIRAALHVADGDVVLIEQHARGPSQGTTATCNASQFELIPMEYWQSIFDAVATATANGVIVVEAGGNGGMNLDSAVYGGRFDRSVRDSGAILVGAFNPTTRLPACFTNFGERVDVCGWGRRVVTTGYGTHASSGGTDATSYASGFGGTSSATPIVAGAVAEIQGWLRRRNRAVQDARTMRDLLVQTGNSTLPDGRHIGPMPDLRRSIRELQRTSSATGDFDGDGWADLAIGNPWRTVDGRSGAGEVRVHLSAGRPISSHRYFTISLGGSSAAPVRDSFRVDGLMVDDRAQENDWFGFSVTAGDFDGDGRDDLAIGAPGKDLRHRGAMNEGRVYVLYGSAAGPGRGAARNAVLCQTALDPISSIGVDIPGISETGDLFGYALDAGRISWDGRDDLAIGAPGEGLGRTPRTGVLQVVIATQGGLRPNSAMRCRFAPGAAADDLMGRSVCVTDLVPGGAGDVLVGVPGTDRIAAPSLWDRGLVLRYSGSTYPISNAPSSWWNVLQSGSRLGESVAGVRHHSENRRVIAAGAPGYTINDKYGAGCVSIMDPAPTGAPLGNTRLLFQGAGLALWRLVGNAEPHDAVGTSLSVGDFDGDGNEELAIGAPGEDAGGFGHGAGGLESGFVTVVNPWNAGDQPTHHTDAWRETGDLFGASLLTMDRNRDGVADLVVLKPGENVGLSAPTSYWSILTGSGMGLR